jgi:hypothetical protein
MDNYIVTHSGITFSVFNPHPSDVKIKDIAHSLSLQCRFTGHTKHFYSVAQHCLLVSHLIVDTSLKLHGLLHDASEAYLTDLARPIKHHPLFQSYLDIEECVTAAICVKFGLPLSMPQEVKDADDIALKIEESLLMPAHADTTYPDVTIPHPISQYAVFVKNEDPEWIERSFLNAFLELA